MRRKKPQYGPLGSISTGTLRPQDLLPAMISAAEDLRLSRDERKTVTKLAKRVQRIANGEFGDHDAYWTDETCDWDRDTLDTILNNHAAPYFYFGSHPGDGADLGYWLSESIPDDFDGLKVNDTSEVPRGYTGEVLHVNDHGNMTLYAASRGRLREVWAIV